MIEITDYSGRRGAMVPLFPKIHEITKENVQRGKFAKLEQPEHVVTWQHKMRKVILDISRRFIVARDDAFLAGIFFYRIDAQNQQIVYVEDVQVAWAYRNSSEIMDGFLRRVEKDPIAGVKGVTFYAGKRIRIDVETEKLVARGHKFERESGWEKLGTFAEAAAALKARYSKNTNPSKPPMGSLGV